jgi:uncharacterized integral membrane protein (TIGR00697 family)
MNRLLMFLVTMFVTLNLIAPIASNKVIDLGITFAAGSMLIGISYGILDIINDWQGKAAAKATIDTALVVRALFFVVVVPLIMLLPAKTQTEGFDAFMAQSARLFFAGWLSLLVGGRMVNTPFFSWLRERTQCRHFALRYLTTSFPTIVAGSIVYGIVGFWGVPKVDVFSLIWGTVVARILIGVAITPLVALARAGVRRYAGNQAPSDPVL